MAREEGNKELWHIPKSGSVHQTIFMVKILSTNNFSNKAWTSGKQEAMGTEMKKAGVTRTGKGITHQRVRTLLAEVPKYLGFVYIDEASTPSKIQVTPVGHELIRKHKVAENKRFKKLKDFKKAGELVEISDVFKLQIWTKPILRKS